MIGMCATSLYMYLHREQGDLSNVKVLPPQEPMHVVEINDQLGIFVQDEVLLRHLDND